MNNLTQLQIDEIDSKQLLIDEIESNNINYTKKDIVKYLASENNYNVKGLFNSGLKKDLNIIKITKSQLRIEFYFNNNNDMIIYFNKKSGFLNAKIILLNLFSDNKHIKFNWEIEK